MSRQEKERPPRTVLGGGHDGRGRGQRADGVVQQGADDGGRGAGHGHLQLHEERRRRRRQGRWQPSDRHADGGEHAGAAPAVRRGRGGHFGRARRLPGGRRTVSRLAENGRDRVARHARVQGAPDVGVVVGRLLVVVRAAAVPVTVPVGIVTFDRPRSYSTTDRGRGYVVRFIFYHLKLSRYTVAVPAFECWLPSYPVYVIAFAEK